MVLSSTLELTASIVTPLKGFFGSLARLLPMSGAMRVVSAALALTSMYCTVTQAWPARNTYQSRMKCPTPGMVISLHSKRAIALRSVPTASRQHPAQRTFQTHCRARLLWCLEPNPFMRNRKERGTCRRASSIQRRRQSARLAANHTGVAGAHASPNLLLNPFLAIGRRGTKCWCAWKAVPSRSRDGFTLVEGAVPSEKKQFVDKNGYAAIVHLTSHNGWIEWLPVETGGMRTSKARHNELRIKEGRHSFLNHRMQ
jgi:hypothetical protein